MTEVPARRLKWRQNYLDVSGVFFFPMNKDIVRVMVESRATRPTRIGVNLLYSTNISMPTQAAVAARVIKRAGRHWRFDVWRVLEDRSRQSREL